jgi:dihydropteroate synthase
MSARPAATTPLVWRCGRHALPCGDRTLVMGIVNVTPDSFSDAGELLDPGAAVARGIEMVAEGADIVDVGGESTRPGSDDVPVEEELRRIMPVVDGLASRMEVPISVDTRKADVAREALAVGAVIVNDVSAGADPRMFEVARAAGAGMVLMHMQGGPRTMQRAPHYDDVVAEVAAFLRARIEAAAAAGIEPSCLCIDPGIGFGKTLEHNLGLLRHIDALVDLDHPVLVGPSRKRFLEALIGGEPRDRIDGTAAAVAWVASRGVHIVRVHDVRTMVDVVRVVDAITGHGPPA